MNYRFFAESAIHESGSKYYQVIRIIDIKGKGVVATHWGKMHPGAPKEPKHHGQCKVERLRNGTAVRANAARRTKEKRGYTGWVSNIDETVSESEMLQKVSEWFSVQDAAVIVSHMVAGTSGDPDFEMGVEADEDDFMAEPEVPVVEAPKSANWGTW